MCFSKVIEVVSFWETSAFKIFRSENGFVEVRGDLSGGNGGSIRETAVVVVVVVKFITRLALLEVSVERLASGEFLGSTIPNEVRVSTGSLVAELEGRSISDGVTVISRDNLETSLPVINGEGRRSTQIIVRVKEDNCTESKEGQDGEGNGEFRHFVWIFLGY